jgi:hypothetical protein
MFLKHQIYVHTPGTLTLQILAFVLLLRHVFQTFEGNSDDYMYMYMDQTKNIAAGLHSNGKSLLTYICKASSVTPTQSIMYRDLCKLHTASFGSLRLVSIA